jgi:hypothetical protein
VGRAFQFWLLRSSRLCSQRTESTSQVFFSTLVSFCRC